MIFFLIFAQNIDCGYTLEPPQCEAVLMSTHNQCFRAKIRENVYPGKPQFYYIKVGCKGVFVTRICFHDEVNLCFSMLYKVVPNEKHKRTFQIVRCHNAKPQKIKYPFS